MTSSRLASGGRINRRRPLSVTFDGQVLDAFDGDTLASAMLASGVQIAGHSVMLGRPRGISSAGPEEATAVIQVEKPFPEPMLTATTVEAVDGLDARGIFGQGRLAADGDPHAYDAIHHHCEVTIVGAGPAGLAAALTAGKSGERVLLIDERPKAGGALLTRTEMAWADSIVGELAGMRNVVHLQRTTVTGYYDDNFLIAVERRTGHLSAESTDGAVRERIWRIRSGRVVLATGAHERPIVFAGNDVPGVMLAESVRVYLQRYGVLAGEQVVVFTAHDDAYRVAGELMAAGAAVVVVDPRMPEDHVADPDPELTTGAVLVGSVVVGTETGDDGGLTAVLVRDAAGEIRTVPADLLAVSGGWNPAVHLYSQAGGKLVFDPIVGSFVPDGARQRVTVVGSASGLRTTGDCVADGAAVGADTGLTGNNIIVPPGDDLPAEVTPPAAVYLVADPDADPHTLTTHFVDVQRDVTVADLVRATGAGLASVEHVKRYTTAGTAHDQGKTSGVLATAVIAHVLGVEPGELGTTTFRPPYTPISFAALAGRERGDLYDPVRTTGAHPWHVAHGAEFENVGQWKRPWFYPAPGEDMHAAVARECAAARTGVAFMDGSTLGKIDVQGPDAPAFLDMLYTNLMSTLKVGMIRYGVMCGPDGMAIDDGTVFRLSTERYLVTTTTGNAAKILDWMEEWLQTEWPEMRVWCCSVTEQWATMALVGPRSRSLLAALAPDLAVSNQDFPFMAWRDTVVAALPARVARISFSGELAYEINVAWHDAAALWDAVWSVGEPVGLTPYGTEAMHVLRAEKGYPIIGQDTDGTITPQDLGMSWVVSKKKADYIGKRSHARPDNDRPDRKHLIALLPRDERLLLPEGAQIVATPTLPPPPVPMLGHVTSSYPSAALDRTFALALLKGGRDRIGETVYVVVDDVPQPVVVTGPVVVDPDGQRRDGDPAGDGDPIPALTLAAALPVSPLRTYCDEFAALSHPAHAGVRIAESPLMSMVLVRARHGTAGAAAVESALGTTLPATTGEVTYAHSDAVLALGPDEFLVLAGPGHAAELELRLRTALGDEPGAVTDVSASRTMLRISGRNARRMLAHGVALDLDRLPESTCAQSVLAQCAVVLFSDGPAWTDDDLIKVLVRSSFAAHLAQWLLLTAPEYV
ncbi:sarcosine oxidase subunit alpha [Nakamurella panacisegetis]|uniref:Sarcosine oxidase subunit alpha n=1 Tax=Nakamurella panacisegetis TaxID=1090615 RepID=A0A1H0MXC7_9ACTN|nr:2Fe-2S iron-sulfur cluster-binding protein [Nakamurella panacisegetis]SDO85064.1 sarcosine oxidase subunit alpha [Nakamurella panacisegetis]